MFKSVMGSVFLVSLFSWPLSLWATSHQDIEKVIQTYFEGYSKAQTNLIKEAFHPDTQLMSVDNGKLDVLPLKDWLVSLEDRFQRGDVRVGSLKIKSVDVIDDAASVKLEIEFEKFSFTDYLSLLLIDGKWRIVGKIYHYEPKK